MMRLGSSATEPAMLRPLHRRAGGRDEEPAPYFAWQPTAGADRLIVVRSGLGLGLGWG